MTPQLSWFRPGSLARDNSKVLIAGGQVLLAKLCGVADLALGAGRILSIQRVMYVPCLTQSLISVNQLGKQNQIGVDFLPKEEGQVCRLYYKGETLVDIPPGPNDMWTLDSDHLRELKHVEERASLAITLDDVHHRLGHMSEDKLVRMLNSGQLEESQSQERRNCHPVMGVQWVSKKGIS
jgi:hypothetical protein